MEELVPQKQNEVKEFRQQHGEVVVGKVTVNMVSQSYLGTVYECVLTTDPRVAQSQRSLCGSVILGV